MEVESLDFGHGFFLGDLVFESVSVSITVTQISWCPYNINIGRLQFGIGMPSQNGSKQTLGENATVKSMQFFCI